jgi:hypothetical protein
MQSFEYSVLDAKNEALVFMLNYKSVEYVIKINTNIVCGTCFTIDTTTEYYSIIRN